MRDQPVLRILVITNGYKKIHVPTSRGALITVVVELGVFVRVFPLHKIWSSQNINWLFPFLHACHSFYLWFWPRGRVSFPQHNWGRGGKAWHFHTSLPTALNSWWYIPARASGLVHEAAWFRPEPLVTRTERTAGPSCWLKGMQAVASCESVSCQPI
jgi:hypothetical protein